MPSTSASSKLCRVWRMAPGGCRGPNQVVHRLDAVHGLVADLTPNPSVKSLHFMKANCRRPACTGNPDAQSAASVENVPEPHIGIDERVPGANRSASNPAASTSLRVPSLWGGGTSMGQRRASGVHAQGHFVAGDVQVELTSGRTRSMLGRWPVLPRNLSTTASFKRRRQNGRA